MKDIVFWGATGQAKVLRDALTGSEYRLVAIFDNRQLDSPFENIPIYQGRENFEAWYRDRPSGDNLYACVAIGGNRGNDRLEIQEWLTDQGLRPLTVIHPRAHVANDAKIGPGSQILAMAAVCTDAMLGKAVIINTASSVDHDCRIGNGVHIGPGARLAGQVHVEDYVFVGTGAIILPGIHIGRGSTIGAGAVVIGDVEAGQTVVGNPAKPVTH